MEHRVIPVGTTSYILEVAALDSSSTIGARLGSLAYNTGSLVAYYDRAGAAGGATAISLITMTKGTWVSGGFVAVDGTHMVGKYQLCIPDAVLATGAKSAHIRIEGATNLVPIDINIDLLDLATPTDIVSQINTTGITNVELDSTSVSAVASAITTTGFGAVVASKILSLIK